MCEILQLVFLQFRVFERPGQLIFLPFFADRPTLLWRTISMRNIKISGDGLTSLPETLPVTLLAPNYCKLQITLSVSNIAVYNI